MSDWHSLYLPSVEPPIIFETLKRNLTEHGYTLYDPFGLLPSGSAYTYAVKLFVAPPLDGWTRVLCAPDSPPDKGLLRGLEGGVRVALIEGEAQFTGLDSLPEVSPDCLREAFTRPVNASPQTTPFDALGGDVKAMAEGVNTKQAQGMFNKLAGRLLKGDEQNAAQGLLKGGAVDWHSTGGQRIEYVMACLSIPNWREPDYVALRDAYALHNRRRRNPNAMLYPGDGEAMNAVPDALLYTPLFAGKA